MSILVLRKYMDEDEKPCLAMGLDLRGVNSPDAYTFVCLENKVVVGVAMGYAVRGSDTARLGFCRAADPTRWDIYFSLCERINQQAIDLGYTYSEAVMPMKENCTNMGTTAAVTSHQATAIGLVWEDYGTDRADRTVYAKRVNPELKKLAEQLKAELDRLKCERVWE